jgi:HPt (histidine-containing phosphotransfer) domain-containing protein
LLRTVSSYLRKVQTAPQPSPLPAPVIAPALPPPPVMIQTTIPSQLKPISKTGAADAMRRAVEGFVARLPGRVDELVDLIAARQLDQLRTLIHQLKGAGTGYGFPTITQTAAKTEAVIKSDAEFDAVRTAVDELIALIRGTAGYDPTKERQRVVPKV